MPILFSDSDIQRLLSEEKPLPLDFQKQIQLKPKRSHKEDEFDFNGKDGSEFRLILRQSKINQFDFSIILAYRIPKSSALFRLRRYNGKSHPHTNSIENKTFYDFHVHTATERYQESGWREDTYAEPTDRFADFHGALRCMLLDCAFIMPSDL